MFNTLDNSGGGSGILLLVNIQCLKLLRRSNPNDHHRHNHPRDLRQLRHVHLRRRRDRPLLRGLLCSQHGRRHCKHHQLAHDAIIAKAASFEAAPAMCQQPERNVYAPVIHTFSSTCFGGISPHCAMGLCDGCYMKDCACKCHQPAPARCRECGDPLRADQHDSCDWCDGIMPALKTNAGKPLSDEEADALLASRAAKPMQPALTMAQRAAVALPADHTPEEFSIYATSRR